MKTILSFSNGTLEITALDQKFHPKSFNNRIFVPHPIPHTFYPIEHYDITQTDTFTELIELAVNPSPLKLQDHHWDANMTQSYHDYLNYDPTKTQYQHRDAFDRQISLQSFLSISSIIGKLIVGDKGTPFSPFFIGDDLLISLILHTLLGSGLCEHRTFDFQSAVTAPFFTHINKHLLQHNQALILKDIPLDAKISNYHAAITDQITIPESKHGYAETIQAHDLPTFIFIASELPTEINDEPKIQQYHELIYLIDVWKDEKTFKKAAGFNPCNWSNTEWNDFYNYIANCIQLYQYICLSKKEPTNTVPFPSPSYIAEMRGKLPVEASTTHNQPNDELPF